MHAWSPSKRILRACLSAQGWRCSQKGLLSSVGKEQVMNMQACNNNNVPLSYFYMRTSHSHFPLTDVEARLLIIITADPCVAHPTLLRRSSLPREPTKAAGGVSERASEWEDEEEPRRRGPRRDRSDRKGRQAWGNRRAPSIFCHCQLLS